MSRQTQNIAAAVGITTAFTLLSKLLGFVREAIVALLFGASGSADAFFVGSALPMSLYVVLGSAVGPVIMPYIARKQSAGESNTDTNQGLRALLYILLGATVVLVVIGMLMAPVLVSITSPGLAKATKTMAIGVTVGTFPSVVFWGLIGFTACVLQAHRRFTITALAPVAQNAVFIVVVLSLAGMLGVRGASWAIMASAAAQFLVHVPALRSIGWRFIGPLRLERKELLSCAVIIPPVMLAMLLQQLNGMVGQFLGSFLASGSIAALSYGFRLFSLPVGLLGPPLGTAVYPFFSEWAAQERSADLKRALMQAVDLLIFVMVPLTAYIVVTSQGLTSVAFERGAFDRSAASLTAAALAFFAIGILPAALQDLFLRGLWAYKDTVSPLWATVGSLVTNIGLGAILAKTIGMQGVALSTALAAWVCTGLLYLKLARHLNGLPHRHFVGALLRNGVFAGAAILPILLQGTVGVHYAWGIVSITVVAGLVFAIYLALHLVFGTPEAQLIRQGCTKTIGASKKLVKR